MTVSRDKNDISLTFFVVSGDVDVIFKFKIFFKFWEFYEYIFITVPYPLPLLAIFIPPLFLPIIIMSSLIIDTH